MKIAQMIVQRMGRMFGLEIKPRSIYSSDGLNLRKLLDHHQINTVIDVGANTGQYGRVLRLNGFSGKIISIEPMAAAHSRLIKNCISDGNWIAAERMAIGNMDGTIEINVAGNSLSSSVLPMLDSHLRAAPESAYVAKEQVPIRKLDSVARDFDLSGNVFVKIDVQGFEMDVLKGAADTLGKVRGLEIELSLVPLYEGQTLMLDMVHHLRGIGFELNGIFPVFKDEISGRLLQVDGVFFRE